MEEEDPNWWFLSYFDLLWLALVRFNGGPYFSDWIPDFTDWAGKYWTIYGMEKGTCHGIVNALDYIKDESNDLLDILFDHIVFI